jgi:hypothetical protein
MIRNTWKFDYSASIVNEASSKKLKFHQERFDWWHDKKEHIIAQIRQEGLEIDENIALEYISPKSRDWERGAQVTVRDDLRKDLNECLKKLAYHTDLIKDYQGWQQVLIANPEMILSLDHEDWQFFFGQVG